MVASVICAARNLGKTLATMSTSMILHVTDTRAFTLERDFI